MRSAILLASLLLPSIASAHEALVYPPPRGAVLKDGPCGGLGSTRGATVTTLVAGSKLMVKWNETIDHPGHYRIAFDEDGQDFPDPASFTQNTEGMPTVVKDLIPDVQGLYNNATVSAANPRPYQFEITLPDIACTNCTLQVIQMMTENPPYLAADDVYYQCADITLTKAGAPDAGVPPTPDASMDEGGGNNNSGGGGEISGGCSAAGGNATGFLALVGLLGLRRRRRS